MSLRSRERNKSAASRPSSPGAPITLNTLHGETRAVCAPINPQAFFFATSNKIPFLLQWLQAIINISPAISAPEVARILVPDLIQKAEVATASATNFLNVFFL